MSDTELIVDCSHFQTIEAAARFSIKETGQSRPFIWHGGVYMAAMAIEQIGRVQIFGPEEKLGHMVASLTEEVDTERQQCCCCGKRIDGVAKYSTAAALIASWTNNSTWNTGARIGPLCATCFEGLRDEGAIRNMTDEEVAADAKGGEANG